MRGFATGVTSRAGQRPVSGLNLSCRQSHLFVVHLLTVILKRQCSLLVGGPPWEDALSQESVLACDAPLRSYMKMTIVSQQPCGGQQFHWMSRKLCFLLLFLLAGGATLLLWSYTQKGNRLLELEMFLWCWGLAFPEGLPQGPYTSAGPGLPSPVTLVCCQAENFHFHLCCWLRPLTS